MPCPKRKTSKQRRDQRSAGKHIDRSLTSGRCQTCQACVTQHSVCQGCGYYKGVKVVRTKLERTEQRQARIKAKNKTILESRGNAPTE